MKDPSELIIKKPRRDLSCARGKVEISNVFKYYTVRYILS